MKRKDIHLSDFPGQSYFHFATAHQEKSRLFMCEQDYIYGVNSLAILLPAGKVKLIAYCLMDNHIHLLLLGRLPDCLAYFDSVIKRLVHLKTGVFQKDAVDITPVGDVRQLRNEICYIHRNPYKARISSPEAYPWSSARTYFAYEKEKGTCVGELKVKEQGRVFKTGSPINPAFCHQNGRILNSSFVSVDVGQKAFVDSVGYFDVLRRFNLESEVAESHGLHELVSFSDQELEIKMKAVLENEFHVKDVHQVGRKELFLLARKLSFRFGAREKQLGRLLGLEPDVLKRIL